MNNGDHVLLKFKKKDSFVNATATSGITALQPTFPQVKKPLKKKWINYSSYSSSRQLPQRELLIYGKPEHSVHSVKSCVKGSLIYLLFNLGLKNLEDSQSSLLVYRSLITIMEYSSIFNRTT